MLLTSGPILSGRLVFLEDVCESPGCRDPVACLRRIAAHPSQPQKQTEDKTLRNPTPSSIVTIAEFSEEPARLATFDRLPSHKR